MSTMKENAEASSSKMNASKAEFILAGECCPKAAPETDRSPRALQNHSSRPGFQIKLKFYDCKIKFSGMSESSGIGLPKGVFRYWKSTVASSQRLSALPKR